MTVLLHTDPGSAKTTSKVKGNLQYIQPLDVQNWVRGRVFVIDDDVTVDVIMHVTYARLVLRRRMRAVSRCQLTCRKLKAGQLVRIYRRGRVC